MALSVVVKWAKRYRGLHEHKFFLPIHPQAAAYHKID
jgi:hypothetical protein